MGLVSQVEIGGRLMGELAQLDDQLVAALEREGQYVLQPWSLPDLAAGEPLVLDSGVAFGPRAVEEVVFLATDGAGLHCIESGPKSRWRLSLDGAGVVGLARHEDEWLVATTQGELWRISAAGELQGRFATARPLSGDPLVRDARIYVPGADGAVYVVPWSALAP
jgi:hypothetical protein